MKRVPNSIAPAQLTVGTETYYTVPTGTISTISNLSFTNTGTSPATITVYNVGAAQSPLPSNILVYNFSLSAGQTYVPPQAIGLNMLSGGTLQAIASVGAVVVVQGSVYETSGS